MSQETLKIKENPKDKGYKKIKTAKLLLMIAPLFEVIIGLVLFILLILYLIIGSKLDIGLTKNQTYLAIAYCSITMLLSGLVFFWPSRKMKKKSHYRLLAIFLMTFGTFILTGSLFFWTIPVLLFFALITLITYTLQIMAAILLLLAVETLPN